MTAVPASKWRRAESGQRHGLKTIPAQITEVMSFSLFSLDFKPSGDIIFVVKKKFRAF
jgi:hypothetical protein